MSRSLSGPDASDPVVEAAVVRDAQEVRLVQAGQRRDHVLEVGAQPELQCDPGAGVAVSVDQRLPARHADGAQGRDAQQVVVLPADAVVRAEERRNRRRHDFSRARRRVARAVGVDRRHGEGVAGAVPEAGEPGAGAGRRSRVSRRDRLGGDVTGDVQVVRRDHVALNGARAARRRGPADRGRPRTERDGRLRNRRWGDGGGSSGGRVGRPPQRRGRDRHQHHERQHPGRRPGPPVPVVCRRAGSCCAHADLPRQVPRLGRSARYRAARRLSVRGRSTPRTAGRGRSPTPLAFARGQASARSGDLRRHFRARLLPAIARGRRGGRGVPAATKAAPSCTSQAAKDAGHVARARSRCRPRR